MARKHCRSQWHVIDNIAFWPVRPLPALRTSVFGPLYVTLWPCGHAHKWTPSNPLGGVVRLWLSKGKVWWGGDGTFFRALSSRWWTTKFEWYTSKSTPAANQPTSGHATESWHYWPDDRWAKMSKHTSMGLMWTGIQADTATQPMWTIIVLF